MLISRSEHILDKPNWFIKLSNILRKGIDSSISKLTSEIYLHTNGIELTLIFGEILTIKLCKMHLRNIFSRNFVHLIWQ